MVNLPNLQASEGQFDDPDDDEIEVTVNSTSTTPAVANTATARVNRNVNVPRVNATTAANVNAAAATVNTTATAREQPVVQTVHDVDADDDDDDEVEVIGVVPGPASALANSRVQAAAAYLNGYPFIFPNAGFQQLQQQQQQQRAAAGATSAAVAAAAAVRNNAGAAAAGFFIPGHGIVPTTSIPSGFVAQNRMVRAPTGATNFQMMAALNARTQQRLQQQQQQAQRQQNATIVQAQTPQQQQAQAQAQTQNQQFASLQYPAVNNERQQLLAFRQQFRQVFLRNAPPMMIVPGMAGGNVPGFGTAVSAATAANTTTAATTTPVTGEQALGNSSNGSGGNTTTNTVTRPTPQDIVNNSTKVIEEIMRNRQEREKQQQKLREEALKRQAIEREKLAEKIRTEQEEKQRELDQLRQKILLSKQQQQQQQQQGKVVTEQQQEQQQQPVTAEGAKIQIDNLKAKAKEKERRLSRESPKPAASAVPKPLVALPLPTKASSKKQTTTIQPKNSVYAAPKQATLPAAVVKPVAPSANVCRAIPKAKQRKPTVAKTNPNASSGTTKPPVPPPVPNPLVVAKPGSLPNASTLSSKSSAAATKQPGSLSTLASSSSKSKETGVTKKRFRSTKEQTAQKKAKMDAAKEAARIVDATLRTAGEAAANAISLLQPMAAKKLDKNQYMDIMTGKLKKQQPQAKTPVGISQQLPLQSNKQQTVEKQKKQMEKTLPQQAESQVLELKSQLQAQAEQKQLLQKQVRVMGGKRLQIQQQQAKQQVGGKRLQIQQQKEQTMEKPSQPQEQQQQSSGQRPQPPPQEQPGEKRPQIQLPSKPKVIKTPETLKTDNPVSCAVNSVGIELIKGSWPSKFTISDTALTASGSISDAGKDEKQKRDPEEQHRAHMRIVAATLKDFCSQVLLPAFQSKGGKEQLITADPKKGGFILPRAFFATLVLLREVMTQNAKNIFGLEDEEDDGSSDNSQSQKGGVKNNETKENLEKMGQTLATGVCMAAMERWLGKQSEPEVIQFLRMVKKYDEGDAEFASCLLEEDRMHIRGVSQLSGARLNLQEEVARSVAYEECLRKHPLVVRQQQRKYDESTKDHPERTKPIPRIPEPNLCHVAVVGQHTRKRKLQLKKKTIAAM